MSFNYKFVEDKEFLARVQKSCNDDMKEIESILRNEYDIGCQYFLIGSGAKNMITEDSNGIIDLDYNINVYNGMNYDGKRLKTAVIYAANQVMKKNGLEDVNDSTSSIETKRVHFKDDPDKREFKTDVAIVTMKDGKWFRLIHDKGLLERYYWVPAPNSSDYQIKAKEIKEVPGMWLEVREEYLRLKNLYLHRNDHSHPSFVCYIEAVNNVYSRL